MNPIFKTLTLAVVAAITMGGAAYFYPWPEAVSQSEMVGKSLFEDYRSNDVRRIRIQRYNPESGDLEQIEVRRRGATWVLPGYKNFPASNLAQTSLTPSSLIEREVLQETTDRAEDHRKYGVVDPGLYESIPNRSALGTKVILEDATGGELANVVIGSQVSDDPPNERGEVRRFVNIPGQPTVYVINFDPKATPTDFQAWVDPNLFVLPRKQVDVEKIVIKNLQREITPESTKVAENVYSTSILLVPNQETQQVQVKLEQLQIPGEDGQLVKAQPPESPPTALFSAVSQLPQIQFVDVRKVPSSVAKLLSENSPLPASADLTELNKYGFAIDASSDSGVPIVSSAGLVQLRYRDGVVLTMLIGDIATDATDQNVLSRYVMFRGHFDSDLFGPAPEKPAADDDGEVDQESNREYLRLVRDREQKLSEARQFVSSFNQQHADWVYLVTDSIVTRLRPDLDLSGVKAAGEAE